jgi:hypothetical protein
MPNPHRGEIEARLDGRLTLALFPLSPRGRGREAMTYGREPRSVTPMPPR